MSEAQFCTVTLAGNVFPAIVKYGWNSEADLTQLPADARIFIDLGERARVFNVEDAIIIGYANYIALMADLEDNSEKSFKGTSANETDIKYDGVNDSYTVACVGVTDGQQIDYLGERWKIQMIKLAQV